MYVDSSAKLRNHQAEQVLDSNMLYLMEAYAKSLPPESRKEMDGSIDILKNASIMVSIFNDDRPIMSASDDRLTELSKAHTWFKDWEQDIISMESVSSKQMRQMLMSWKTREDITFMCVGFQAICKKRTKFLRPVLPSRINSDVIENFFCNQRAMNGQNNNPTLLQYQKGINSVLLSTGCKGTARKSNAGSKGIEPYSFSTPKPLRQ